MKTPPPLPNRRRMPTLYRRRHDVEVHTRPQFVEIEGLTFHQSHAHAGDFASCRQGCHDAGDVAVDNAIAAGELVPVVSESLG
jgi:hypothetical protein